MYKVLGSIVSIAEDKCISDGILALGRAGIKLRIMIGIQAFHSYIASSGSDR